STIAGDTKDVVVVKTKPGYAPDPGNARTGTEVAEGVWLMRAALWSRGDRPAARDLVDRQRADRRGDLERLARNLRESGRLRPGTSERRALALLLVLTSYETFCELREAGLSERELTKTLQESGRALLLA